MIFINIYLQKLSILFTIFMLVACGGGGSNIPVSSIPNETSLENESVNNLFPILDLKEIETPEYFNQWGLDFINASSAYVTGASGKGTVVAVVDEALDWQHYEFLREDILHPDSILTYSGNREPTPWEKFHGTATTSIIAARRDAKDIPSNMHGVAYDAQILFIATELGDPPADGEYAPTTINRYDWSYYDQNEASLYNELSNKVDIVNNSFGFTGQITDYPKETFATNFPKFINSLRNNKDTIFVWSAGNYNGITNSNGEKVDASDPGWLAGLSYYFPELADNNIAVVAVDSEGKIADWSNRCGVVKSACLAAPGSRINVAIPNNLYVSLAEDKKANLNDNVLSYLKDHPTEAYLLASGTSFAAPHISGALAVLKSVFKESLSSREIINRLYTTANKDGEYANEDIYGQGLLDLGAAISPVGFLSAYNENLSSSNSFSLSSSSIKTGLSFGDSLKVALKDLNIAFFDALGAPFFLPIENFIQVQNYFDHSKRLSSFNRKRYQSSFGSMYTFSSWDNITNKNGYNALRLNNAGFAIRGNEFDFSLYYGLNPSAHLLSPDRKFDFSKIFMSNDVFEIPWLKFSQDGFSLSLASDSISKKISTTFFSGSDRQEGWENLPFFIIPKQNKSYGFFVSYKNQINSFFRTSNSFGILNKKDDYLSGSFSGAFGNIKSIKTLFYSNNNNFKFTDNLELIANLNIAKVLPVNPNLYIGKITKIYETSFDFGLIKNKLFFSDDTFSILLRQKPHIEKGFMELKLPIGRDENMNIYSQTKNIFLKPSRRNLSIDFIWTKRFESADLGSYFQLEKNSFNTKENLNVSMVIAIKRKF